MNKFKNYEEIEKYMVEEYIETYVDYVRRDLEDDIEKKWHEFMEQAKYNYIVLEHPHQRKAEIYVIRDYKDEQNMIYDSYERDNDLSQTYKYLQQLTITDAIVQCFDLWDLNSWQIFKIDDLKSYYPKLEDAVNYIYNEQSYHNMLSKEHIETEIANYWE